MSILIFSIDATNNIYDIGRMVNDAQPETVEENVLIKIVVVDQLPHLCLFALRDIEIGEELRYDYGIDDLPWRKKVKYLSILNITYVLLIKLTEYIVSVLISFKSRKILRRSCLTEGKLLNRT